MKYSQREKKIIAAHEKRIGRKIGTAKERKEGFKKIAKENLKNLVKFKEGLDVILLWRLNLDNIEYFDSEEELVKTKILLENQEILNKLLRQT